MPIHSVAPGEWLAKIAKDHALAGEASIYEAPENETLRNSRPDPHTLHPGDEVFIPEPSSSANSVKTSRFVRFVVTLERLRLQLVNEHGEPYAQAECTVSVDGQDDVETTTDEQGVVDVAVRGHPESGTIQVGNAIWTLRIGHLNPMHDTPDEGVSGAQARLVNLGYVIGEVDGKIGPLTRAALRAFQREAALPISGQIDDATMDALLSAHRS